MTSLHPLRMDTCDREFDDTMDRALRARIQVERDVVAREEILEREYAARRKELLISGPEDQLEALEEAISNSRTWQVRALERIDLLEQFVAAESADRTDA